MPQDPIASIITRQIHLNRFSNGVSNRLLTILNNAYLDAIKQLNEIQLGTSGTSASSYQAQRLRAFLVQTRQAIISAGQQGEIILIQSLQGVAEEQVKFIEKQLAIAIEGGTIDGRKISPIASPDSIPSNVVINSVEVDPNYAKAIATRDPNDIPLILQRDKAQALAQATADAPVTLNLRTPLGTELARTLDNVPLVKRFRAITEASADLFDNQVRIGLTQNETTDQIVKRLVGKIQYEGDRTFLGKGALLEAKNSQVRSLVRTSVQSVANAASQAVYQSNQHVTKKYKYVATLDSRTTAFCQAHDGKIFEYGDGPVPPVHFSCRSTTCPVISYRELGISPPSVGSRASVDGPVAADMDYSEWLKQQPVGKVEEILGKGKASLFLGGKVKLSDLVRADTREVTLKELREKFG
jgi:SPP1 gp7 family putative phage head morphogenesis protein